MQGPPGLKNPNTLCYQNSTVQMVSASPGIKGAILEMAQHMAGRHYAPVTDAMAKLLESIDSGSCNSVLDGSR